MESKRFWISTWGKTTTNFYMCTQSSLVEDAVRDLPERCRYIWWNLHEILYMFSRRYIWQISRSRKNLHIFCWEEVFIIILNKWADIILLKYSSRITFKEKNDFGIRHFHWCTCCCADSLQFVASAIIHNVQSHHRQFLLMLVH